MRIARKINGKESYYDVFTKEQALEKRLQFTYWQEAEVGEYAITDDNYVALCYDKKDYTDKKGHSKTFVKLICGVGWCNRSSKILFEKNHEYGVYTKTNPSRTWDKEEYGKNRAKNTITAYAQMLLDDGKVNFETLGQIYRPDQEVPAATVRRFLKTKTAKKMTEEKIKEILAKKSINREFAVENIVLALKMAEQKGDVNNFLKANDYLMDLLEMKPNTKMITDTIQVDMTKQIADTIAKEDKRLILQRKSEQNETEQ